MRMNRIAALTMGAGMITMAACSDSPTAPTKNVMVPKTTSFAVGDLTDDTPVLGVYKICKEGNAGGSFDVTRTAEGASSGTVSGLNTLIDTGECRIVGEDNGTTGIGSNVSFTEDAAANTLSAVTGCVFIDEGGGTSTCAFDDASRFINSFHGFVVTVTNTFTPPTGNEGCTPGYWKQTQHFGNWPISRTTTFGDVGITTVSGTLLAGLSQNGGGLNALARAAAAGYLNAASGDVDYAYTTDQVVAIANGTGAYSGLSVEARKNLLDGANNGLGGCPLARAEEATN